MDYMLIFKALISIYGPFLSLGLIAFIILAILSIFLVSIFTKTPFSFGIGFFKINFGRKEIPVNKESLISNLLEYQQEHVESLVEIENSILKRQVNYTEQKLSELKYLLTNNYMKLLSAKLQNEDVKIHKDYRNYQIIVSMLIKDLITNVFKDAFLENHLEEFDEVGWKKYNDDKSIYIMNFINDFLDYLYDDCKLVTRRECFEKEKDLFPEIKDMVRSVFDNARSVSNQLRAEIRKKKEEHDLHIKQICKSNGFELE